MSRAGYVLVGGRGSRMGQNKALLPFRGATLGQYVADMVAGPIRTVTVVGDPERYGFLACPVLALAAVHSVVLPVPETGHFGNVNTPADWTAVFGQADARP